VKRDRRVGGDKGENVSEEKEGKEGGKRRRVEGKGAWNQRGRRGEGEMEMGRGGKGNGKVEQEERGRKLGKGSEKGK
jgi:hypothetical protein